MMKAVLPLLLALSFGCGSADTAKNAAVRPDAGMSPDVGATSADAGVSSEWYAECFPITNPCSADFDCQPPAGHPTIQTRICTKQCALPASQVQGRCPEVPECEAGGCCFVNGQVANDGGLTAIGLCVPDFPETDAG